MYRRCNLIFFLLLAVGCQAIGQEVSFVAAPSANKMGVKDMIRITFTVRNVNGIREFRPQGFGDFTPVNGPYQSTSIINGAASFSIAFDIQPRHEGKLTIPPCLAKDASGHTYQSNAVSVEVVPGSLARQQPRGQQQRDPFGDDDDDFFAMARQQQAQMQAMMQAHMQLAQRMMGAQQQQRGQTQQQQLPEVDDAQIKKDIFIRVTVDKNKVHQGEQITASYKLYSRLPMQMSISKLPSLNGFWTQDFDIPRQPKPTEEVIDGKKYQVFLLKKSALFPQETGTLELDPAEAKGVARIVQQVRHRASEMFADPFGHGSLMMSDPFFDNAFFNTVAYRDVQVNLSSTPVKITVVPVPDKNKPADYGGAVGNFTISAKLDKQDVTTDDVATFTMNITGSGNLKLLEAPKLQLPNGLNTYDPQIIDTITGRSTTISGSKIVTYAITPHTVGDYDIPSLAFTYFNPQSGTYTTLHTQPFKMHVTPGKNYNPATPTVSGNTIALKDIHDIATAPIGNISKPSAPLLLTVGYWSMYAVPMLAFLALVTYRRRNEELAKDTTRMRMRKANKVALQRLATARKLLPQDDRKPFYDEISKAIWLYLSDRLGIPLSTLSRDTALASLNEKKVPADVQKNFESVIWDCETALYATGSAKQKEHTYEEAVKVISDLENYI